MHVQTDTVAGAVRKIVAAAVLVEMVAGNCVNVACVQAAGQRFNRKVMGLPDKAVEFFLAGACFSNDKRAGFIRAVAIIERTVINSQKIPGPDFFIVRRGMGQGTARA